MVDQQTFEHLLPLAYQWCKATEEFVLAHGAPLGPRHLADARLAGVQNCARIRVMVVDRVALPDDPELAGAARRAQIVTKDTRCIGFGHALIVRADGWGDRELLVHNLVHVAQCERTGGLEPWVHRYLGNRRNCAEFTIGSLEEEARTIAQRICTAGRKAECSTGTTNTCAGQEDFASVRTLPATARQSGNRSSLHRSDP